MAKIIINCKYIKGGAKSSGHLSNLIKYMATRDGVAFQDTKTAHQPATVKQKDFIAELLKSNKDYYHLHEYDDYFIRPTKENASAFISAAADYDFHKMGETNNLVEYMAKRPGAERKDSHGLFSLGNKDVNLPQAMKEVSEHEGHIWTMIASLRREDAERLNYNSYDAWKNLLNTQAIEISKNYGIPIDRLQVYGAFHNESHHPHMHLVIFSKDGTSGNLNKEGISRMKSRFANEIFQDELYHLYEQKTVFRDTVKTASEKEIKNLVDGINQKDYKNPAIEQLLFELAGDLKNEKYKTYGRIRKKNILAKIDAIVYALSREPDIEKFYKEWANTQKQVFGYYKINVDEPPPLHENTEFKSIKNMVIKKALEITEDYKPDFASHEIIGPEPTKDNFDYSYSCHEDSVFYDDNYINDYQAFLEMEPAETSYYEDSGYYDGRSWEGQRSELNIPAKPDEKPFPPSAKKYFADWTEEYQKAKSTLSSIEESEVIKGIKLLEDEADKGNLYAMYDLAGHLYRGTIADKDEEQAARLYEKVFNEFSAMSDQNIYIHYRLGRMYKMGLGTNIDYQKAITHFESAIIEEKNYSQYACYSLAKIYQQGLGVDINMETAFDYYKKAAAYGNPYAAYDTAKLYEQGTGTNKDMKMADDYYAQAFSGFQAMAETSKDDNLHFLLGRMYYRGIGTDKDIKKAVYHLKISSSYDNHMAQYLLGKLYLKGEDVEKDIVKALDFLHKSAGQNNQFAQYQLGRIYLFGLGVAVDKELAKYYLTLSAAQGNEYAHKLLNFRPRQYSPLVKLLSNMLHESYLQHYRAFTEKKLMRKILETKLSQGMKME